MDPNRLALTPVRPEQIHVYHLKRSGGHGVVDWILAMHDGHKIHYNQAARLEPGMIRPAQICPYPGDIDKPLLELLSCEDLPLRVMHYLQSPQSPRRTVLMLRDPYNLFASRLKMKRNQSALGREDLAEAVVVNVPLWKEYAREYVAPRVLPHAIRLNFNRWYDEVAYRKEMAERLELPFSDRGFGSKAGWVFSRGSSFGERDPRRMDLGNRWKSFQNDPEYLGYFDDEVRALAQQIFGMAPPV
jgi:hypothetical protein